MQRRPLDLTFTLDYKALMNAIKRTIAATELLLVFPATLFMTALFVRNLQPTQYEPAHSAKLLVEWFSVRPHLGLDVFLLAMPFVVLVIGCATLLRGWRSEAELRQAALATFAAVRAHLATLLIAGATLAAGGILAIVALHMITD
jgi:hypothetical protein